jgi:hypothetical protein
MPDIILIAVEHSSESKVLALGELKVKTNRK